MKEITTTYSVTYDGETKTYTGTYDAYDVREAHWNILNHWCGTGAKIEFINDIEK